MKFVRMSLIRNIQILIYSRINDNGIFKYEILERKKG